MMDIKFCTLVHTEEKMTSIDFEVIRLKKIQVQMKWIPLHEGEIITKE
jgi:hypothetical protein